MSRQQQDDNDSSNKGKKKFLEILGDTIVPNQLLLRQIIIGSDHRFRRPIILGLQIFPAFSSENMVASYSLLLGIVGTVFSLALCSIIFKPKRILLEEETSSESMHDVFEDLRFGPT